MTKIIVQHFVENLLKMLKVLKTRTALTGNGLAEFRCAPHGRALSAFKPKEQGKRLQNYYNHQKLLKKPLTRDRIESRKERKVIKMKYGIEYFDRNGWNASVDMYKSRYYAEKAKQSPNDVIIRGKKTGLYKIMTRKEYREYKERPSWIEL